MAKVTIVLEDVQQGRYKGMEISVTSEPYIPIEVAAQTSAQTMALAMAEFANGVLNDIPSVQVSTEITIESSPAVGQSTAAN